MLKRCDVFVGRGNVFIEDWKSDKVEVEKKQQVTILVDCFLEWHVLKEQFTQGKSYKE